MSKINYRPEIDGLRAIAVLAVVFFHAELGFDGGFVGVDVFFVISGFLITSLLMKDAENGVIDLVGFWERRIRRIIPALTTVLFASLLLGLLLYFPSNLISLGEQLRAQAVFLPNFLFYTQSGYFDTSNDLKLLLHTWSLAVEEQFYLFFPLLFYGLYHFYKKGLRAFFGVLALLSFLLSVYWIKVNPEAAFFLLPARAWELLLGSLIALFPLSSPLEKKWGNAIGFAGLTAILAAAICYSDKTPFPGVNALLPTLGSAAIIFAAQSNSSLLFVRILSWRPFVFTGLISYSLYLWHWPIISMMRYQPFFKFNTLTGIVCVVLSFMLAYLTWKYVERPFRKKGGVFATKGVYIAALCVLLCFAVAGQMLITTKGIPARMSESALKLSASGGDFNPYQSQCDGPDKNRILSDGLCQTNESHGKPEFLVWGDSFAGALTPAFFETSQRKGVNGSIASYHTCPPIVYLNQHVDAREFKCFDYNLEILSYIERNNIKTVFLVSNWLDWFKNKNAYYEDLEWCDACKSEDANIVVSGIKRTIELIELKGAKVVFVAGPAWSMPDPVRYISMVEQFGLDQSLFSFSRADDMKRSKDFLDPLLSDLAEDGVSVIDLRNTLCDDQSCMMRHQDYSLYIDKIHLSTHGALFLSPQIDPYLKR